MVIVIPYCERYNYLRLTLCTLKESLRDYNFSVILYNTDYEGKNCELGIFKEILNISEFTHIRRNQEKNLDYLIPTIINEVFTKTEEQFIVLLDSDTIVHPEAIKMFLHMQNTCENLGIGSLFNTARFPFIEVEKGCENIESDKDIENNEDIVEFGIKKQVGGFGLLINREAWLLYCSKIFTCWDAHATLAISDSETHHVYCSKNSYLEHIGMVGSHRYLDKELGDPLSIDRAWNFFN